MVTLSQVFAHNILKHASSRCPAGRTGRPRTLVDTEALSVLFKVTRTGMQWREVSATVSYASVFRRVQAWAEKGVVLDAYRETLRLYKKLVPTRHSRGSTQLLWPTVDTMNLLAAYSNISFTTSSIVFRNVWLGVRNLCGSSAPVYGDVLLLFSQVTRALRS